MKFLIVILLLVGAGMLAHTFEPSSTADAMPLSLIPFSKAAESAMSHLKETKFSMDNGDCLLGIRKEYYDSLPDKIKSKFKNPNVPIFVVTYGYLTPSLGDGGCIRVFVNSETYKGLCVYVTK